MYEYIRCSCGREIDYLYEIYKEELTNKIIHMDSSNASSSNVVITHPYMHSMCNEFDMKEILDALKVFNMCCRAKIMTQVEFSDVN